MSCEYVPRLRRSIDTVPPFVGGGKSRLNLFPHLMVGADLDECGVIHSAACLGEGADAEVIAGVSGFKDVKRLRSRWFAATLADYCR